MLSECVKLEHSCNGSYRGRKHLYVVHVENPIVRKSTIMAYMILHTGEKHVDKKLTINQA